MQLAPSYLDELDRLLLDKSDDCMLLSQLDGFLTGIVVCPDLILPSRWLKCVWSGEDGQGAIDHMIIAYFVRLNPTDC